MRLVTEPHAANAVRWMASDDHYRNWLESVQSRREPIAPVAQAARSLHACATAWISMKLGRTVTWDPSREEFVNDTEANALRRRTPRSAQYDVHRLARA